MRRSSFFGDSLSEAVNTQVRKVVACIENWSQPGVIEYVPAYTTITIYYDPLTITYQGLLAALQTIVQDISDDPKYQAVKRKSPSFTMGMTSLM
ncbi:allophanate hydrolase subunit 1 [Sphingobacterium sp. E70]|uniref:allophanate hydrolase subunit 1 n=1 Tax=Sphingobacterium sp. E70 TaxID=2853439 RepID=UPI00211CF5EC|nr:allophanate hydrolase subunit 1 [Sphingobacterium sp. E70]